MLETNRVAHLVYGFVHRAGSCIHVQIDGLRAADSADVGIAAFVRRGWLASEYYVIGFVRSGNPTDRSIIGIILNRIGDKLPERGRHGGADRIGNRSIWPQIAGISYERGVFLSARFGRRRERRAARYVLQAQNHVALPDFCPVYNCEDDPPAVPPSGMALGCYRASRKQGQRG